MKSIVLDTNALLRFLLNDIPSQRKLTEQLLNKAKNNQIKLIIVQAVVFEIDFILRKYYLFEKEVVLKQLKPLISTKYLGLEDRDIFSKALTIYEERNISFVDSFLLAKVKDLGGELFTFDQDLNKLTA